MKKVETMVIKKELVKDMATFNKIGKLTKKEKEKFTKEMEIYAQNFLKENFNMSIEIPIVIDGRLTSTGGSYHHTIKKPIMIKISERFMYGALLDDEGVEAILDVLKHELVHYALHMQGKDYNDGQKEFEETLAKLNIGSSGATASKKRLSKKRNVWYSVYDLYYNGVLDKVQLQKHTKKEQSWSGMRVGYSIVKTYF